MRFGRKRYLLFTIFLTLCFEPVSYCEAPEKELAKDLAQTIASLFSLTIQNYFIASRWNLSGTANAIELRSLVPFKVWNQENLMRASIPFRTASELGPGLSDVRVFDLVMFKGDGIFWGVGPIVNLGVNKGPGIDTFQAGPAATFMITWIKSLSIGVLNQNFFSDQFAFSTLQPIVVYQPNTLWTLSLGELPIVYNWKSHDFAVFSLGIQIGALIKAWGQPIRFFVDPQFNTRNSTQLYRWTVASGVTLPIVPVTP